MKRAAFLVLVLVLAGAGALARADELTVGKVTYRDVEIRDVSAGKIGFTFYGRMVYKPLADVVAVRLGKDATFNKAEAFLAEKKFDNAIALYTVAKAASKKKWQDALIDYRLGMAVAGKLRSPMGSAGPADAAPAAAKSTDPLESADAFADILDIAPERPAGISAAKPSSLPPHLARAWRQYAAKRAVWEKKVIHLRGKKVTWELIFQSAVPIQEYLTSGKSGKSSKRPRRSGSSRKQFTGRPQGVPVIWGTGFIVEATSEGGVGVLANVASGKNAKGLESLKPRDIVQITGRIRRDLEPGAAGSELYLAEAVVKPTGKTAKPEEGQTPAKAKTTR